MKNQNLVWYLMTVFMGILILGGGAWANSINTKVEKIASMEANIQYIQRDISDIKQIIETATRGK